MLKLERATIIKTEDSETCTLTLTYLGDSSGILRLAKKTPGTVKNMTIYGDSTPDSIVIEFEGEFNSLLEIIDMEVLSPER